MRRLWNPFRLVLTLIAIEGSGSAQAGPIALQVDSQQVVNKNVSRIGINIGPMTSWGAEQFRENLIANPGFEGRIFRAIVFVTRSTNTSFFDDKNNIYVDGFWDGGQWEVRTGESKGKKGTVKRSIVKGEGGLPQYLSNEPVPPLKAGDVIILSKIDQGKISDFWWVQHPDKVAVDPNEKRPGTPGTQSMVLNGTSGDAEVDYYLNNIYEKAGKLIQIEGKWKLSFWAKAQGPGSLLVTFRRFGTPDFFNHTFSPANEWKEYVFQFDAADKGAPNQIELKMVAKGAKIWIDDLYLGNEDTPHASAFRQELIRTLKELKPSFIRFNSLEVGTLEQGMAEPFARKTATYAIQGNHKEVFFFHSYPEQLDLCAAVGANPWLSVPTTFSPEEYYKLGTFLAQHAEKDRFSEVIVEFGNENWNSIFRPHVFLWPYYSTFGVVCQMAYENIEAGAKQAANIRFVVGGQHANPHTSFTLFDGVPSADTLAPAAYFMGKLDKGTSDATALEMLFEEDPGWLKQHAEGAAQRGKTLAVYEYNLHTSSGTATETERDRVVAGRAAGAAFAKRSLYALSLDANPICVYTLAQFSTRAWDVPGQVKLWGVVKSLGPPPIYRPTGLALLMLNRIIGGDMYLASPEDTPASTASKLTSAAFRTPELWTAAVVSQHPSDLTIELEFPNDGHPIPSTYAILDSKSPFDTNEESIHVGIVEKPLTVQGRKVRFTLPAWNVAVLGSPANFSHL